MFFARVYTKVYNIKTQLIEIYYFEVVTLTVVL